MLVAVPMNRDQLVALLVRTLAMVESGDCMTGFLEFGEGIDVDNPDSDKNLLVKGVIITPQGREEIGNQDF